MTFTSEQELTSWVLSPHLGWSSAQQVTVRLRPQHGLSDGEEYREGADCCRHLCVTHHLLPLGAADCLDVSDESWGSTFLLTDGISSVLFWFCWLILPSVQCFVILHQHISAAGRTFMGYFALLSCSIFFLLPIMLLQGSVPCLFLLFFCECWWHPSSCLSAVTFLSATQSSCGEQGRPLVSLSGSEHLLILGRLGHHQGCHQLFSRQYFLRHPATVCSLLPWRPLKGFVMLSAAVEKNRHNF